MSVWSMNFSMMIGLAVGIDYSLFIVSRYREERAEGKEPIPAIENTMSTAGKAVFLSALTVALSLAAVFLVPVTVFQTETDVGLLGAAAARQPDTKRLRTWEAAGTAHADVYTTLGFGDTGDGSAEVALLDYTKLSLGALNCTTPVNAGPQYAVLMAAVRHLDPWRERRACRPPSTP